MTTNLTKGKSVNITQYGFNTIRIKLGWSARPDIEICAVVFLLDDLCKAQDDASFIYYNNKQGASGAVKHLGDRTNGADIEISLTDVQAKAPHVSKIAFLGTIHDAKIRKQNFGQVDGMYISVVNASIDKELACYELSDCTEMATAIVIGELSLKDGDWCMTAVDQGFEGGLDAALVKYGLL